ncbi:hypothetical protein DM02DRAFT_658944 [Periconia macrospinosa]|uniref:F-box domain-containing protein n=1 Tax=Periconia macrospinosa TaxID=97972 RepID=A0A2V1DF55_9PLEO|nr:hypothetical protein DM02DRAFT_658944 [Periconia macrospinosa]
MAKKQKTDTFTDTGATGASKFVSRAWYRFLKYVFHNNSDACITANSRHAPSLDTAMQSLSILDAASPYILKLPDELLLCIARNLDRHRDLVQLSRANKRLWAITQDAFYKNLHTPSNIRKIFMLINELCRRQDLAAKINHINLTPSVDWVTIQLQIANVNHLPLLQHTIDHFRGAGFFANLRDTWSRPRTLPSTTARNLADIYIALAPNLTGLTTHIVRADDDDDENGQPEPYPTEQILPLNTLHLLENHLQTLQVLPTDLCWGPTLQSLRNITLTTLTHLTHLSIPMNALMQNKTTPSFPEESLPPNLTHLHLTPCNKHISSWLEELPIAFNEGNFPHLTTLSLSFPHPSLHTALIHAAQGEIDALDHLRSTIRVLTTTHNLSLHTYVDDDKLAPNIVHELDAWHHMTDLERDWAATKGVEFSTIVKRDQEGKPVQRSRLEVRALLRGSWLLGMLATRRGCGFNPRVCLDGVRRLRFGIVKKVRVMRGGEFGGYR